MPGGRPTACLFNGRKQYKEARAKKHQSEILQIPEFPIMPLGEEVAKSKSLAAPWELEWEFYIFLDLNSVRETLA